jgi:(1->4)-alpha-D-glucan 1-alpha-D-glucosylmutase
VEDTAFYNYNRPVSLNEVGGDPGRSADFDPVAEFHQRNERIARDWPDTMNASSTHDTKRSEDIRARINVLSELAEGFSQAVKAWSKINAPHRRDGVPHPTDELLLYQTLIGMWPLDEEELPTVPERLRQYMEKASREAKTHTSWITPNVPYEKALLDFGDAILQSEEFRNAFHPLQRRVAFHGFLNSLAQVTLKVMSPGVPDFYQGTEMWDFSLVDPDNRRPVDYDRRISTLKKLKSAEERGALDMTTMLRRWGDGRVKLFVTWRALQVRARNEEAIRRGGYRALPVDSPNVCAFLRGQSVLVAVPRLTAGLVEPGTCPLGDAWKDLVLDLAPASAGGSWKNAFTEETLEGDALALSKVFATFPVAILERA